MWLPASVDSPPEGDWIDLATAKIYLRADGADEDAVITGMIAAAGAHVEAYTGMRLLTQTVSLAAGSFTDLVRLPIAPVQEVAEVTWIDPTGAEQTLDSAVWEQFGRGLAVGVRTKVGQIWPAARAVEDAVRLTATVGFGAAADIPGPVRQACLLLLADFYSNREDTIAERGVVPATLPNGVATLLTNYRIW